MLHQNELVLNSKETDKFGDLISTFSSLQSILGGLKGLGVSASSSLPNQYIMEVNIENVNGATEQDARQLSDILNDEWTRQMRTQRGVR